MLKYCDAWLGAHSAPNRFIELFYSIGFFGIKSKGAIDFRAIGTKSADMPRLDATATIVIHPSYEDALALQDRIVTSLDDTILQTEGFLLELPESFQLADYTSEVDRLLNRLDLLPRGKTGASEYEEFVGQVIKLCFFRTLNNVQPKPRTVSGTTVRDWVAANVATIGFWEMVRNSYNATQIIWECKNYNNLESEDFHQAQYYMGERWVTYA